MTTCQPEIRCILHADLDAFYAAVEQMDNPQYRGKPVLVGGSPQSRGVVATASYEARKFGAHSAMPMATAVRLCPQAIIVRPRFDRYRDLSQQIMDIFRDLTPDVEPLSLDEAYLDVSPVAAGGLDPHTIAARLKNQVKSQAGLDISIGASVCKTVSKIASDLRKPNGLVVVPPGEEAAFLAPLPAGKLPGIGPKAVERLNHENIHTVAQLAALPFDRLIALFGKRAPGVRAMARGEERDPVHTQRDTKSVSAETTFATDLSDSEELYQVLSRLSHRVAQSLENKGLRGKTVSVKLRLADFTTFTRQATLNVPTDSGETVLNTAWRLTEAELAPGRAFRLIGVGVSSFQQEWQLTLPFPGF